MRGDAIQSYEQNRYINEIKQNQSMMHENDDDDDDDDNDDEHEHIQLYFVIQFNLIF